MEENNDNKYIEIAPGIRITIGSKIAISQYYKTYIGEVIEILPDEYIIIKDIRDNIVKINIAPARHKAITILSEKEYERIKTKYSKFSR